jgi:hypothetical protein
MFLARAILSGTGPTSLFPLSPPGNCYGVIIKDLRQAPYMKKVKPENIKKRK